MGVGGGLLRDDEENEVFQNWLGTVPQGYGIIQTTNCEKGEKPVGGWKSWPGTEQIQVAKAPPASRRASRRLPSRARLPASLSLHWPLPRISCCSPPARKSRKPRRSRRSLRRLLRSSQRRHRRLLINPLKPRRRLPVKRWRKRSRR